MKIKNKNGGEVEEVEGVDHLSLSLLLSSEPIEEDQEGRREVEEEVTSIAIGGRKGNKHLLYLPYSYLSLMLQLSSRTGTKPYVRGRIRG